MTPFLFLLRMLGSLAFSNVNVSLLTTTSLPSPLSLYLFLTFSSPFLSLTPNLLFSYLRVFHIEPKPPYLTLDTSPFFLTCN